MKILTITIGILTLFLMNGTINADDHSAANNTITLSLDGTSEVSVRGFIAPIEHTLSNFHVRWEALANLRVAEPEKQHPVIGLAKKGALTLLLLKFLSNPVRNWNQ